MTLLRSSYTDRVRQAKSPQEALLVIAEALDFIVPQLEKLANPLVQVNTDPWGTWDDVVATTDVSDVGVQIQQDEDTTTISIPPPPERGR